MECTNIIKSILFGVLKVSHFSFTVRVEKVAEIKIVDAVYFPYFKRDKDSYDQRSQNQKHIGDLSY